MKFLALFALCYLVGAAVARDVVSHADAVEAAHHRLDALALEVIDEHKPVVHTRGPFDDLDLAVRRVPSTAAPESGHHIGAEHNSPTEDHSEAASTTTGFPVTEITSTAASAEHTDATSVPVTSDATTDADHTDSSNTGKPTTSDSTDSSNTESASTDSSSTGESTTNDSTESTTSDSTESTNTDSTATDSNNTEPTTDPTDKVGDEKPKGMSTATISAIVIGGVLALAVVVAVAMAIVRRRRMAPERRGILDA